MVTEGEGLAVRERLKLFGDADGTSPLSPTKPTILSQKHSVSPEKVDSSSLDDIASLKSMFEQRTTTASPSLTAAIVATSGTPGPSPSPSPKPPIARKPPSVSVSPKNSESSSALAAATRAHASSPQNTDGGGGPTLRKKAELGRPANARTEPRVAAPTAVTRAQASSPQVTNGGGAPMPPLPRKARGPPRKPPSAAISAQPSNPARTVLTTSGANQPKLHVSSSAPPLPKKKKVETPPVARTESPASNDSERTKTKPPPPKKTPAARAESADSGISIAAARSNALMAAAIAHASSRPASTLPSPQTTGGRSPLPPPARKKSADSLPIPRTESVASHNSGRASALAAATIAHASSPQNTGGGGAPMPPLPRKATSSPHKTDGHTSPPSRKIVDPPPIARPTADVSGSGALPATTSAQRPPPLPQKKPFLPTAVRKPPAPLPRRRSLPAIRPPPLPSRPAAAIAASLAPSRSIPPGPRKPPAPAPPPKPTVQRRRSLPALPPTLRPARSPTPPPPKPPPRRHHHNEALNHTWSRTIPAAARRRYEGLFASNCSGHKFIENFVVRELWQRSRLENRVLAEVWRLVDRGEKGRLNKEEWVVGLWIIDTALRGGKAPARIEEGVWKSAGGVVADVTKGR